MESEGVLRKKMLIEATGGFHFRLEQTQQSVPGPSGLDVSLAGASGSTPGGSGLICGKQIPSVG
jgi:hypothetical protein